MRSPRAFLWIIAVLVALSGSSEAQIVLGRTVTATANTWPEAQSFLSPIRVYSTDPLTLRAYYGIGGVEFYAGGWSFGGIVGAGTQKTQFIGDNTSDILTLDLDGDADGTKAVFKIANGTGPLKPDTLVVDSAPVETVETLTIDFSQANDYTVTLTANVAACVFTGLDSGGSYSLEIIQDSITAKTFAFPATVNGVTATPLLWSGGVGATAISTGLDSVDMLWITCKNSGDASTLKCRASLDKDWK